MGNRPFRRILVGWDCSADAENALRTAAFLVAGSGGHVVALGSVSEVDLDMSRSTSWPW